MNVRFLQDWGTYHQGDIRRDISSSLIQPLIDACIVEAVPDVSVHTRFNELESKLDLILKILKRSE